MKPNKRQLAAMVVAVLLLVSGAAAYSAIFTAGGGTSYETGSGLVVSSATDHGLDGTNPFNDSETVYLDGVSFSASGSADVTVDQFRGNRTELSSVDATSSTITVDPDDKSAVEISGGVTAISWEDAALDNRNQITYSANSAGTITATDLASNTEWTAATPGGELIDSGTTSASGQANIDVDSADNEELILFINDAPDVDNTSASPTGELSQQMVDLSIDAADAQFGSAQGDELTTTFYVDGESVGSDTLSSNGTASVSYTSDTGGSKSWYVVVNDSYGASTTSDTFEFSSPASITFRQEENPDQLVDNATVQVTAYYSGEVQRRTVTDGKLNLTDFPVDEPIIVRSNASGYYTRTVVLESIYDQSNVYLLNSSQPTYTSRFELQDLTGEYPESETILVIERDLKLNGSTGWRAIVGDNFGVNGVSASLVQDERYRLRIKNLETGRTSVIGAYTAIQSETVTVSTGSASIDLPETDTAYSWAVTQNDSSDTIKFRYLDEENSTQEVKLTIHERFNKSNVLVDNVSFTDANEISYQRQLTTNESNTTWMAEVYIDRGGEVMHFRAPTSGGQQRLLPVDLDQVWVSAIGVFIVLISSLAFSQLNLGVGAISTALTGGILWWFGLLDTVATGPTIVAAIMMAVVFHYYSSSPGGGA